MNLLQSIGKTPLVRLAKLNEGIGADILVKIESRNPGGSIKDRAALRMIEGALERGILHPKGTIVEPTSGNTGIGLAVAATCMGFRLILTMPESMSEERKALLRGFGAELILTPAAKGMGGAVEEAQRLAATKGYVLLDQFSNPDNADAHYRTTGPELLADAGQIDAFVAGVGTGGTITGTGRYLREHLPSVGLYAVEPAESAVLSGKPAGPHLIQGIGAGFVPKLLDRSLITEVLPIPGEEAIHTARRLMTEEGISCGISSGANVAAALLLARRPELKGKRIVTVLPDTGERYLSTQLFKH
uniref:cysteine synthase A n=1 Tax=uncultured Bilophila sp. TaxID=529385 RepID=UPI0025D40B06|nr:cysteine synthase A [uncultured Bilophila sp.]